ncbi:LysR family transcriptional regulator [Erysipelothrix larvae]|uniref:LysR family transcriptional regulator n=1 Tax=Erysipelothrix larvae TaxID=1514105 RepID=A0A120JTJ9_9FIRM|nr:LysR family transcriptional regulator [Erysipelothrix larvae]AMC93106.1 LysR family transcriptional regulator [Erysipelothrix larvae]
MDVKDLKYFITVVEAGSFSAASKVLHVTQPALSWNIKQLEEELGLQLLKRYNHGIKMTMSGQLLYEGGKDVVEGFERLERLLRSDNSSYLREVKFGLTTLFAIEYMDVFESFKKKYDQYNLTFTQRGSKEIQNMLIRGEIDIGLTSEPTYYSKLSVNANRLEGYYIDLGVLVGKDNPLFDKTSLTLLDLKDMEFSMLTTDYAISNEIPKRCSDLGFQPKIVYENENWEVIVKHVESYGSISILPSEFEQFLNREDIKWIKLDDPEVSRFNLQLVTSLDLSIRDDHVLYWRVYNELLERNKRNPDS